MDQQTHVDTATMDMLQDVLEGGFAGLLHTFLDDSTSKIAELHQGLAQGDAEQLRRAAHSLKGSSANLGANPLSQLCLQVEQQARAEQLQGLDAVLASIDEEFALVAAIMSDKLESL